MTSPITVTYRERIAVITINRPEKLNALDQDLYYQLGEHLREIEKRDDISITVLTGAGRFFSAYALSPAPTTATFRAYPRSHIHPSTEILTACSGADVTASRPSGALSSSARRDILRSFVANNIDVTRAFYSHSKILVVALNGPVVGLSAALVAFADFIYATPHTFLLAPFASLGLVAEGGASRAFVERMGISKANEALIMSKRITCAELEQTGFVNKVISAPSGNQTDSEGFLGKVLEEVDERLGAHLNQSSLLKIKELIRRPGREVLERQNGIEAFMGLERFLSGVPQEEFRRLASGEKKHKL